MRMLVIKRRCCAAGQKQKTRWRLNVNSRRIRHVMSFFGTGLNPSNDGHLLSSPVHFISAVKATCDEVISAGYKRSHPLPAASRKSATTPKPEPPCSPADQRKTSREFGCRQENRANFESTALALQRHRAYRPPLRQ